MNHARATLVGLATGVLALSACSDDGPKTIEATRIAPFASPPVIPGVTAAQRFGWRASAEDAQRAKVDVEPPPSTPDFVYALPDGWERVPTTRFRIINARVTAAPSAECYLTFLPGDGGGDLANVNRWRGEMGLAPVDPTAVAALPRTTLLGGNALRTDLSGSFTGMSGQRIDDARLLGVLLTRDTGPGALFVKFVGPADVIADNADEFDAFVASIDWGAPAAESVSSFVWSVPAGWTQEPGARAMRDVTLTKGGCELYISVLGGGGGGLLANVNRWQGQFGAAPLGVADLAGLERVPCLGSEAYVVDAEGPFRGMDGATQADMALLGALLEQPTRLVTIKLVGPANEVRAERAAFVEFVGSLSETP